MNIEYTKLHDSDLEQLKQLISLYEDVFEMKNFKMPANDYLLELLADRSIIFYIARVDNIVVGGLTAHLLPSTYFRSAEVYIYDLAVKTLYQRKGIGTQLIASLREYCKNLGMKEIFVQADVADQYAIDFYAKTGGIPERVIHFSYDLNNNSKY